MGKIGNEMFLMAKRLWPINRCITGTGLRETLDIIATELPLLQKKRIPTGTKVFDWTIPNEWYVEDAFIICPSGKKICDFKKNNLHLVAYSIPINKEMKLRELQKHLFSIPDKPNAIPYVTSFYKKTWGFCIKDKDRKNLKKGVYKVFIKSKFIRGYLDYGELLIKGRKRKEVFLSTYICHPSMANNELSGPVVTTYIAKWLKSLKKREYSYRVIFIPETIGSISYLSKNIDHLKKNVIAGFNINCIGDERAYSFLPSRKGNTLSDKIAEHVLRWTDLNFKSYSWQDRGSDERQYCSPKVNLPIASIMRSKFGEYPEYHTSLDRLGKVVTAKGLHGGYTALQRTIEAIEKNIYPITMHICEPNLGKRNLFPTLSNVSSNYLENRTKLILNVLTWSDGKSSLLEIAEKCEVPIWALYEVIDTLKQEKLIEFK